MAEIAPIDWQRVCLLLRKHHGPLTRVAKQIGASEKHLQNMARGDTREPSFSTGVALLDLAHDCVPPAEFRACSRLGR